MNQQQYFIRFRGKVTGPFSVKQLKELRARGQLSTFHEVSEDRTNWVLASSLADVFSNGKPVKSKGTTAPSNGIPPDTKGQANGTSVTSCPPLPPPPFQHSPKAARKVAIIYWVLLAVILLCLGGGGFFILNDTWERDRNRVEQQSRLDKEASDRTKREREDREQRERLERERLPEFRDCLACGSTGKQWTQCDNCVGKGKVPCSNSFGESKWHRDFLLRKWQYTWQCNGGRLQKGTNIDGVRSFGDIFEPGVCSVCNGEGFVRCWKCNEKAGLIPHKCARCGGEGHVR